MSKIILETERLILREMNNNDFEALCKILLDEETMYAYQGAFTIEEAHNWLNSQLERYKNYGYGLWAVVLKENNEMIGQCGLSIQTWKNSKVLEVGYLFQRNYWHHGYATEAAIASKEYAFNVLNANEVSSIIRTTNTQSINVALRNGMKKVDDWVKHYRGVDMPHYRYVVHR